MNRASDSPFVCWQRGVCVLLLPPALWLSPTTHQPPGVIPRCLQAAPPQWLQLPHNADQVCKVSQRHMVMVMVCCNKQIKCDYCLLATMSLSMYVAAARSA